VVRGEVFCQSMKAVSSDITLRVHCPWRILFSSGIYFITGVVLTDNAADELEAIPQILETTHK